MNHSDDKKLEIFLKENRPLHPRHSERDAERIWAQISMTNRRSFGNPTWIAFGALAAAAMVAIVFNVTDLKNTSPNIVDETTLVEETLDLEFMENGEIYEVTDLLSLAK